MLQYVFVETNSFSLQRRGAISSLPPGNTPSLCWCRLGRCQCWELCPVGLPVQSLICSSWVWQLQTTPPAALLWPCAGLASCLALHILLPWWKTKFLVIHLWTRVERCRQDPDCEPSCTRSHELYCVLQPCSDWRQTSSCSQGEAGAKAELGPEKDLPCCSHPSLDHCSFPRGCGDSLCPRK